MAKKFTMSLSDAMYEVIDREREERKLGTIQETIRVILSEYVKAKSR